MHPISYSLVLNILTLLVTGFLALAFNTPWLVLIAMLTQTHAIERFRPESKDEDDEDEPQPMGFTADVK